MQAEHRAPCAQEAKENDFVVFDDYEEENQEVTETSDARRKRRREEEEQMGEDEPKRKAPRHREPSPEPWYLPSRCRCTKHMTQDFCEGNLKTPPGSMTESAAEWNEAQRPRLEDMVIDEHAPSKRFSDAELDLVWTIDTAEAYNPRNFPFWAKQDDITIHLQRQLKRSRPGGRQLGDLFLDVMDGIESETNLDVARCHRPPKLPIGRSSNLDAVNDSGSWPMSSVDPNGSTQHQLPQLPTKQGRNFEIVDNSRSRSISNVNSNVATQNQPPELPTRQGSQSDAIGSFGMRPTSYMNPTQCQPLELRGKQGSNVDAADESGSRPMSNIHSNVAAQNQPPELSTKQGNNSDAMDGIGSRPMSNVDANVAGHHQPPKLPSKQGSKKKRGGKGAMKKGSIGAPVKRPSNGTAGAPSMKKTKAKKVEGATPPWLHSLLAQPRQTRSQHRKILYELDAQSQVVPTQSRRSQRNVRL
ncbi:MAG: hypothetical protein Q9211_005601 [Gyalolechia sp. 1 TL-2023]